MITRASELGVHPTAQDVDKWFLNHQGLHNSISMERISLGKSVQHRTLFANRFTNTPDRLTEFSDEKFLTNHRLETKISSEPTEDEQVVILMQSLIHGNEVLGLLTLMQIAERVLAEVDTLLSNKQNLRSSSLKSKPSFSIIFFPIVNPDAYHVNLQVNAGCRRTNLRPCSKEQEQIIQLNLSDKSVFAMCYTNAVDLNRNFPADWDGQYSAFSEEHFCSFNHRGAAPFSEPETQAVKKLVLEYNVTHFIRLHSRAVPRMQPLLIHPFASFRPMADMLPQTEAKHRQWVKLMRLRGYKVGTALEAIEYAAGGTTLDWTFSQKIMAFVHEAAVPNVCTDRWCGEYKNLHTGNSNIILKQTIKDSEIGSIFVKLAPEDQIMQSNQTSFLHFWLPQNLCILSTFGMFCIFARRSNPIKKLKKFICWGQKK